MKTVLLFLISLAIVILVDADSFRRKSVDDLHREPELSSFRGKAQIRTEWIKQKLDNFNESDSRTWQMRYMANEQYFKAGGPIFIFVGGEWSISEYSLTGGHMFDMAKDLNGYMFYTEHRYYGKSHPTKDLSTENLQYLNVDQSLADLAYFIKTMKKTIPGLENSGVILVGASYSATMVTWFKRIYPDLATGAWSSSAPLLAKIDFTEYKEIVGQSMKLVGGEKCYNRIKNAFKSLEKIFTTNKAEKVKELFKVCDNFDSSNKLDVWSFFGKLSDIFAELVEQHIAGDIEEACKQILAAEDDISGVATFIRRELMQEQCNDFTYLEIINELRNTTIDNSSFARQWQYQKCSEFGWYKTSGSKKQPFGTQIPVELYTLACKDIYGEKFSNATIYGNAIRTNSIYGGLNPEVSNVIFTHGELDPWRILGVQEHPEGESNIIPLYAHCEDLTSISSKDTNEMKATKEKVTSQVREWLGVKKSV